ncbi:MAG: metallophosphoesterase family protein [Candidatus Omnitrophota bacterium]
MKIGVISDIHVPSAAKNLPAEVRDYFKDCDLIIHAGDAVEISVIKELEKIAKTKAVRGNMDNCDLKRQLPEILILNVENKKIGVTHGSGSGDKVIEKVKQVFKQKLDIIIFGHSHLPFNDEIDGTLFLNPGSPTDRIFSPYRSIGIIEINGGIRAKIIKLEK